MSRQFSQQTGRTITTARRAPPALGVTTRAVAEMERRRSKYETDLQHSEESNPHLDISDNEEEQSESPIMDTFIEQNSRGVIHSLTGFTYTDAELLWAEVGLDIELEWRPNSGPRPKLSARDAFFIAQCVVHTPTTWAKHGIDFGIRPGTLEQNIHKVRRVRR